VFILLESSRKFEEGPEQGSPIIVDQLNQSCLLHQATQLNQMPRARASVLNPLALVVACSIPVQSVTQHGQTT
jgi:hypothetical protein